MQLCFVTGVCALTTMQLKIEGTCPHACINECSHQSVHNDFSNPSQKIFPAVLCMAAARSGGMYVLYAHMHTNMHEHTCISVQRDTRAIAGQRIGMVKARRLHVIDVGGLVQLLVLTMWQHKLQAASDILADVCTPFTPWRAKL